MGCVPEPYGLLGEDARCKGGCDKDRMGYYWRQYFVFHIPPFGMRVRSNALGMLMEPFIRRWQKRCIRLIVWIDDLLVVVLNPPPKQQGLGCSDLDEFLD